MIYTIDRELYSKASDEAGDNAELKDILSKLPKDSVSLLPVTRKTMIHRRLWNRINEENVIVYQDFEGGLKSR